MSDATRYLTIAELEARRDRRRIYELANDKSLGLEELDADDDEMDAAETIVETAIGDAADVTDRLLGERMTVPLETVDGVIKRIQADLAMFYLAKRRHEEDADDIRKPFDEAVAALGAYGAGGTQPPFSGRDHRKPFRHHHHHCGG
jgi:phage gp36-like protein